MTTTQKNDLLTRDEVLALLKCCPFHPLRPDGNSQGFPRPLQGLGTANRWLRTRGRHLARPPSRRFGATRLTNPLEKCTHVMARPQSRSLACSRFDASDLDVLGLAMRFANADLWRKRKAAGEGPTAATTVSSPTRHTGSPVYSGRHRGTSGVEGVCTRSATLLSQKEAEVFIAALDPQPTLVVHSGHGYQLWWLFEGGTWALTNDNEHLTRNPRSATGPTFGSRRILANRVVGDVKGG